MGLEIHVPSWERHANAAEINRIMGSQGFPFYNWISIDNTDISKNINFNDNVELTKTCN
jgi:hypothetical protein